ncbi:unnamed protein product [Meloidogyne enterolobii]|uniref:Uncharacterized protein n=1 Tax=Meloidogyne enterolobii TaxID=390850 RepID=A0ACB1B828_MELEN
MSLPLERHISSLPPSHPFTKIPTHNFLLFLGCLNFLSKNKISAVRNISLKNRYQLSPSFSSPISIDPLKPEGGQEQPKLSSDPREALAQILNRNHNKLNN